MAYQIFQIPKAVPLSDGRVLPGAKAYFFESGTTTPQDVYSDSGLTTPHTNPVVADSAGVFPAIYLDPTLQYKITLKSSADVLVYTIDPANDQTLSPSIIGQFLYPQTTSEIAASATPVNNSYQPGNVLRYGTNATPGTTDMTAAVQAAINQASQVGGAPVYAPCGTYLVDTLTFPNQSSGTQGFVMYGDGANRTIFQSRTANTPIMKKTASAGALEYAELSNFGLKAHASGSTTAAMLCTGFRSCKISDVFGISNGTAGFASLFDLSASPYLCYGNEFDKCGLSAQTGWTRVWYFNNNGTVSANNSNSITINNPWVYSNTGLTYAIDALASAKVNIIGGTIEANTGATAIRPGTGTTVLGTWLELNAADFVYNSTADGAGNGGHVIGCYFSTAHTIDFTAVSGNVWIGNTEPGAQTWTNNNGTNVRLKTTSGAIAAPTLARTAGDTGVLTLSSATLRNDPNLQNSLTYLLSYTWTSTSAGTFTKFALTPPSGWAVSQWSVGSNRNASGQPRATSIVSATEFFTDNVTNDAHSLVAVVTIQFVN